MAGKSLDFCFVGQLPHQNLVDFFLNGDFGRFTGVQGACVLLYVPLVWCLDVLKNRSRVDWKNATRGWHEFVKPLRTHKATLQQGVFLQSCGGGGCCGKNLGIHH